MTGQPVQPTPAEVISFWREAGPQRWFKKDAAFDDEIRQRFLSLHEAAATGKLTDWEKTAEGALALLILALVRGFDSQAPSSMRGFFYLPFEHSENLADQERAVAFYKAIGDADGLKWAELHADIIRRFGRFPHRNAALGRATTLEEQAFLEGGGFSG